MMKSIANEAVSTNDVRLKLLRNWLNASLSGEYALEPASSDASFRRYFRIRQGSESCIAMDASLDKADQESCAAFVRVAGMLREAGLNAPKILAQDLEQGFLLMTDLGQTTYLAALQADARQLELQSEPQSERLMRDAIGALVTWQRASQPGVLPEYTANLLGRELALFPEWYLQKHLKVTFTSAQQAAWQEICAFLIDNALGQAPVFVHRDYMARNLMVSDPNPGILDFQDAVYGPITYDLISLCRDAFISWDEEQTLDWIIRYWERARLLGLPVATDFGDFYRQAEWMGVQRHLKVLGIFARIAYRDGKPAYLADAPRFVEYLRAVTARYSHLKPLRQLLESCGVFVSNEAPSYSF